jgi:hypothetical protein
MTDDDLLMLSSLSEDKFTDLSNESLSQCVLSLKENHFKISSIHIQDNQSQFELSILFPHRKGVSFAVYSYLSIQIFKFPFLMGTSCPI